MSITPWRPEGFTADVVERIVQLQPGAIIERIGPRSITVNGRRFDLENLYRMVMADPENWDQVIQTYLVRLLHQSIEYNDSWSWNFAKNRLYPRIQPTSIFENLPREVLAHTPFVNSCAVFFVLDFPEMTVSVTTAQMVRWGKTPDELDQVARENLEQRDFEVSFHYSESNDGGRTAVFSGHGGYDAALVLLPNLYHELAPRLGPEYHVAMPSRDVMVAFSIEPKVFVDRLRKRLNNDYQSLPYPITPELFVMSRDGVAGTIADGEE